MDPINPEHEENRAPTLQGSLFLHPTACTKRIASYFNITRENIATLTVSSRTQQLYQAVIEYAALTKPHDPFIIKPLFICPEDPFERHIRNEEDSDSDDDNYRVSRRRDRRLYSGMRTTATRSVPLKFKWALGEATVSWPPPPTLSAEFLRQKREQALRKKSSVQYRQPDIKHAGDTASLDGSLAMLSVDHADESPVEKNDLIYLVHYSLEKDGRILLMASPREENLRAFAQEIVEWRMHIYRTERPSNCFSMLRFKSERHHGYWHEEGWKRARPPKSVILHEDQMQAILSDVDDFLSSENRKWYIDHGLPHRRCFLFYGPPGTGKTSTIRAIATQFGMSSCFLSLTDSDFSNQTLGDAFSQIPKQNALLVLEDIDTLFDKNRKNEFSNSLTFSGLLNALDGFISVDGVLTVMTTNHADRLDEALTRGGRVDRKFFFGHPSQNQIEKLFLTFYPEDGDTLAHRFAVAVLARPKEEKAKNIATLQELFVSHRKCSAEECISAVSTFFKSQIPVEDEELATQ